MNRSIINIFFQCFLASVLIIPVVHAQPLTREDFNIEFLTLRSPIDSVLVHLPKPDRLHNDETYEDFMEVNYFNEKGRAEHDRIERARKIPGLQNYTKHIGAQYRRFTIWYNKFNKSVRGVDIQDPSFHTVRGVAVGDSVTKLRSLYGKGVTDTHYSMFGPVGDDSFRDYSMVLRYSSGDYILDFFINRQIITKILAYFELSMWNDNWGVGPFSLEMPAKKALAILGKPDTVTEGDYGTTGYYFRKYVIWKDNTTRNVCAMDIYDSSYATPRGLKVGSSLSDVIELYGDLFDRMPKFERFGPYDFEFHDYTEAMVYGGDPYFVVFVKGQTVVKLLFYIGVYE